MTKVANHGVSLNYALEGRGSPPIVFIHGLGGSLLDFDFIAFHLKQKHRILRMDLRGFGKSDKPLTPEYSTELWASDVYQLMEALKMKKAFICGHSMGARVAAHFAHLYPEMTRGLISLDMTFWGSNPSGAEKLEELSKKISGEGMKASLAMIPSFSHSRTETKVKNEMLANDPEAFVLGMEAVAKDYRTKRPDSFFEKIQCPSLICVGDKDSAPLDGTLALKKQLTHSSMAMIPNCNHFSMLDQPHLVLEMIQRFLFETLAS